MNKNLRSLLLASTALGFLFVAPAQAADTTADAIKALQAQVNALQKQLGEMQVKEAAKTEVVAAAPVAPDAQAETAKKEILPGVKVKVGGYISMDSVYRDHNEVTDPSSSTFTSIPYANARAANQDEFRMSARATRLSLLAEGKADKDMSLAAYVESDFMGSAVSANSVQSNSYTPRLRQAFGQIDRSDWGFHTAIGQSWSMVTLTKGGLMPRNEAGVQMIDTAGTPGFVYTRNVQARFVKDVMDKSLQVGVSLEGAQTNTAGLCTNTTTSGVVGCGTFNNNYLLRNAGGATLNTGTTYSMDYAPDVIAKVGYDNSLGHFEAFSLTRFFRDTVVGTTTFRDNYAVGQGAGVGTFLNVIPKKLEVQANVLAGTGVGRYSSGQFPDIAVTPSGDIKPIMMYSGMVGVIGHPTPTWDVYVHAGVETAERVNSSNSAYGYGSTSRNTGGCYSQTATDGCEAQTQTLWQIAPGFWNTVYKGDMGNIKLGAQYSFTRKDAFTGSNDKQPHAYENMIMTSFRYSPF